MMKALITSSLLLFFARASTTTTTKNNLDPKEWDALRTGLAAVCPDGEKEPNRFCPLITASKDFLAGCPAIPTTLDSALSEDERAVMKKYLKSYLDALRSLGRKEIKEKDDEKRKKLEEEQKKKEEKLKDEEKEELAWGNDLKKYLAAMLVEKDVDRFVRFLLDTVLQQLERMQKKKREPKPMYEFLLDVEKILDRLLMLHASEKPKLEEKMVGELKKMVEAVEMCRPFHQRTVFIVITTLVLLAVMSVIVGAYLVKTTASTKK